ncbi:MAG: hypothetical protein RM368_18180 [Nostoc sp. DedSLP03]|uniref:hypothetical protein n=1 Tax=Nostoc sp. DedSLP03 TaxID=3075400 RepID=UPI002AD4E122|nr:hypothetical protein [Nostoc sp. DedSLP03]MDZ7966878.1 hypothetical protein [Nostoc sp. DedSLP03]
MTTTTKELTVEELIQELQDFPSDAHICLTDAYGETFTIIGFEAGSDCVNMVISTEDAADDDDDKGE